VERNWLAPVRKAEAGLVRDPFDSAEETAFSGVAEANCIIWLRKPLSLDLCERPLTTAAIDDWIPSRMVRSEVPKWLAMLWIVEAGRAAERDVA
jgi:hypothetical protein